MYQRVQQLEQLLLNGAPRLLKISSAVIPLRQILPMAGLFLASSKSLEAARGTQPAWRCQIVRTSRSIAVRKHTCRWSKAPSGFLGWAQPIHLRHLGLQKLPGGHLGHLGHIVPFRGADEVQSLDFDTGIDLAKWYFEASPSVFHKKAHPSSIGVANGSLEFTQTVCVCVYVCVGTLLRFIQA